MKYLKLFEQIEENWDDSFDEEEVYDEEWEKTRNEFIWQTAKTSPGGERRILLKDMEPDHLKNVILWIRKYRDSYRHPEYLINIFNKELEYRGLEIV